MPPSAAGGVATSDGIWDTCWVGCTRVGAKRVGGCTLGRQRRPSRRVGGCRLELAEPRPLHSRYTAVTRPLLEVHVPFRLMGRCTKMGTFWQIRVGWRRNVGSTAVASTKQLFYRKFQISWMTVTPLTDRYDRYDRYNRQGVGGCTLSGRVRACWRVGGCRLTPCAPTRVHPTQHVSLTLPK